MNRQTAFAHIWANRWFGFTASGEVFEFLSETGHRNLMASSFSDWLMKIESAPEETLDVDVVEDWMSANEIKIGAGLHLCPRIPFSLGGAIAKFEDAYLCPAVENMRFKGQLASQLRRLKPGDKVDLRAINLPPPIDTDGR